MNLWVMILIAMPFWILAWYIGRVILLNKQRSMGIFKHCIHCGKPVGDYDEQL